MARKPSYRLVRSGLEGVREDYTAIFVATGSAGYEEIARRMVKDTPHISAASALQAVKAFFNETADLIGEDADRVNHAGFAFAPAIRGSLLHADSDLGPDNEVYVNVIVSEDLLAQLQAISLERDSAPGNFRFDKVIDIPANEPGFVTAGAETALTGDLMSVGAEDESVTLTDGEGEVHEITATAERHGCSLRFDTPSDLAPGKGSVAVTSRGLLTPDAKPETIRRAVMIRPGEPVPADPLWRSTRYPIRIDAVTPQSGGALDAGETWNVRGEGLKASGELGLANFRWTNASSTAYGECEFTAGADGTTGTLKMKDFSELPDGEQELTFLGDVTVPEGDQPEDVVFTLKVTKA